MRKNTIRQIWAAGGAVVNGWCSIPSSFSAEVMAHQGFDSLCIDTQHGAVDYQVALTMLQAISTTSVIPIVRVPWNDPGQLMKMLDAGAYGVICPMINNRAQAEALASCLPVPADRHPQLWADSGEVLWRRRHPRRRRLPRVRQRRDHRHAADRDRARRSPIWMRSSTFPASTRFMSGRPIWPWPWAVNRGPARTTAKVVEAKNKIIETCKRHGIPGGIHTPSAAVALQMIADGYQFVTIASDDRFLMTSADAEVSAMRKRA